MSKIGFFEKFFNELNQNQIEYCVLESNEEKKFIDIYVQIENNDKYVKLLSKLSCKEDRSRVQEYSFIYKLKPDVYYTSPEGVTIHSACQMSCVSLSNLNKCKLPLDNCIQTSLWKNKLWDEHEKYWKISDADKLIQILTKCIFNQKKFDEKSVRWIKECNVNLEEAELISKLEGVFFFFTPELIQHIKDNRFDVIIHDYRTFRNY